MLKVITKENIDNTLVNKIANKLKVEVTDFDLISYDSFLFAYIFILAIKDKTIYLYSTSPKKIESLATSNIDKVLVDKKTDLNLYFKGGRVLNLTSVVGVKPKVINLVRLLNSEIEKHK